MQTNKDYEVDEGKSVLLVGDSGTHKTYLAGSFPKPMIFDFDRGLHILRGKGDWSFGTFKDAPYESKLVNPNKGIYPWGTAWLAFIKSLNVVGGEAEAGKTPFSSIVFDSLTTMSSICMNYVLKENNRTPKDGPRIQDWGAQIGLMETVMDQVTAWPFFYKIATAHVQRDTNMLTQQVEKLPLVTGKLAGKISIYFDEVYFTDSRKNAKGEQEFFLRTTTDPSHRQAKSRFGVPDNTAATWEALKKYLENPAQIAQVEKVASATTAK